VCKQEAFGAFWCFLSPLHIHVGDQVKADERTKAFLDAYSSQKMRTDVCSTLTPLQWFQPNAIHLQADEAKIKEAKLKVDDLVRDINQTSEDAANTGKLDKEKYIIPPHLHDLQEADLPETQRGLVISEIAQFRERAAKREREKQKDSRDSAGPNVAGAPSGPKIREWGKPQNSQSTPAAPRAQQGFGKGAQSYQKPVNFVKGDDASRQTPANSNKTDEELEKERIEARRQDEENSFRDV